MDNQQAIRPSFYKEFTTDIESIEEEPVVDENQQALSYITHFKGWELLKEYAGRLKECLDVMVSEAMAQGMSMSELGERTMVKELSKFVLDSFIKKAEDARNHEK